MAAPLVKDAYDEGWQAHQVGWPLLAGHTEPYRRGWLAREAMLNNIEQRGYSTPRHHYIGESGDTD